MQLLSVNVGQPRELPFGDRVVCTAIVKSPVSSNEVVVTEIGIEGDTQVDQKHHGGIEQAIYAYFEDSYEYWRATLKREDLTPGTFGDNLTIAGLMEETVCIGDVYAIGDVHIQVSQPRQPCYKLGLVMGDEQFVERFLVSRRLGAYFRVLRPGRMPVEGSIQKLKTGTGEMSLSDVCRLRYFDKDDLEGAAACVRLPDLSPEWREYFLSRIRGTRYDPQKRLWPESDS